MTVSRPLISIFDSHSFISLIADSMGLSVFNCPILVMMLLSGKCFKISTGIAIVRTHFRVHVACVDVVLPAHRFFQRGTCALAGRFSASRTDGCVPGVFTVPPGNPAPSALAWLLCHIKLLLTPSSSAFL